MTEQITKLPLFPAGCGVNKQGYLLIGGCDTVALAKEFGTPLYIFDELSLRNKAAEYKDVFRQLYPDTTVNYSCKAFINKTVLRLFAEEGLGLDTVSGGEIGYALAAGFPASRIDFPGNNKAAEELALASSNGT